mmetsp:Transcript_23361/g.53869  ORF Transcript_23361/g.53869 Transcript_23361/m.53869 type:complete len:645 (+) Transcript_23361:102-2036(+)
MIIYENTGHYRLLNLLLTRGSVFPRSLVIAIPAALLTAALRALIQEKYIPWLEDDDSVMSETQAWSGFSFLVGFLIVFRTNMAYNRFWDGCTSTHAMRAEWFDAASSLVAFCKHSKEPAEKVERFKHILVRLFSMLHAAALAEIEDEEDEERCLSLTFDLIDAWGIDEVSMKTIQDSEARVELIFEWIQMIVVENIQTGVLSIPPPILSRAFQEVANGMVQFHEAFKISTIPFPFPYAQTCDCLLVIHWIVVPFVTSAWVMKPYWAGIFAFVQVFILWALNFIATEIENPFGQDPNDISGCQMQDEMNKQLLLLLYPSTQRVPQLSEQAIFHSDPGSLDNTELTKKSSFKDVWDEIERKRRIARAASEATLASMPAGALEHRPSFRVLMSEGLSKAAGQKYNEPKRSKDHSLAARRRKDRRSTKRSTKSSEVSQSETDSPIDGGPSFCMSPEGSLVASQASQASQASSGSLCSEFVTLGGSPPHRASSPHLDVNFGRRDRFSDKARNFDLSPEHRHSGETKAFSIEIPKMIPRALTAQSTKDSVDMTASDTCGPGGYAGTSLGSRLRDVARLPLEQACLPAIVGSDEQGMPAIPGAMHQAIVKAAPAHQQVRLQWHTAGDNAAGPELFAAFTSEDSGALKPIEV